MGVVEVLVLGGGKLLLSVVEDISPLGVDPIEVLSQHLAVVLGEYGDGVRVDGDG